MSTLRIHPVSFNPAFGADSVTAGLAAILQEPKGDLGLFPLQAQMGQKSGEVIPEPLIPEPQDVIVAEFGTSVGVNADVARTANGGDVFEKTSSALSDTDDGAEFIVSQSRFRVVSDAASNTNTPVAVENACEIADLEISQHGGDVHNGDFV